MIKFLNFTNFHDFEITNLTYLLKYLFLTYFNLLLFYIEKHCSLTFLKISYLILYIILLYINLFIN